MGIALVIVVGLVIAGIVAYLVHLHEKKRREALAALAGRLGFSFDPSKDASHDDRYRRFGVFRKGHSRAAYNTMRGPVEIDGATHGVVMGDFRYRVTRSNGKTTSTHTYRLSYLIVELGYAGVPDLTIRPEGVFDKIGQALGFDDIDFEDVEFSRKFVVTSGDRRFAYDVCHPLMIEWLKERASGFPAILVEDGALCLARDRKRWDPAEFEAQLGYAREFIDRWPDHVLRDLRGGARAAS
jgi:hypothetical protein